MITVSMFVKRVKYRTRTRLKIKHIIKVNLKFKLSAEYSLLTHCETWANKHFKINYKKL